MLLYLRGIRGRGIDISEITPMSSGILIQLTVDGRPMAIRLQRRKAVDHGHCYTCYNMIPTIDSTVTYIC